MDNKKRLIDADELLNTSIRITGNIPLNNGRVQPIEAITVNQIESAPTVNAVELPCIAMIERSIKDGKMNPKHSEQKFNGRYAVVYIDKSKWGTPLIDICGDIPYNTEEAEKALKEREEND